MGIYSDLGIVSKEDLSYAALSMGKKPWLKHGHKRIYLNKLSDAVDFLDRVREQAIQATPEFEKLTQTKEGYADGVSFLNLETREFATQNDVCAKAAESLGLVVIRF